MMNRKVLSMLSLCQRAGKLASGELSCEKALQNGTALLIIIAEDASLNTKDKFINKAYFYEVPVITIGTRETLGRTIGKDNRAVLAVCDENFAVKIKDDLDL